MTVNNVSSPPNDSWQSLEQTVITCRLCPRLVEWREKVAQEKRRAYRDHDYWGKPVPGFGDYKGRLFIVGLAPGAHGSNRTGRVFTGDSSGETLFGAMYRTGFANQAHVSDRDDGLQLRDAFITAVGRCAPPGNKPTRQELANCTPYLHREWQLMPQVRVILALGQIAFQGCVQLLKAEGYDLPKLKFQHGLDHPFGPQGQYHLMACYHPSRQNTQTGRLTLDMIDAVFLRAKQILQSS